MSVQLWPEPDRGKKSGPRLPPPKNLGPNCSASVGNRRISICPEDNALGCGTCTMALTCQRRGTNGDWSYSPRWVACRWTAIFIHNGSRRVVDSIHLWWLERKPGLYRRFPAPRGFLMCAIFRQPDPFLHRSSCIEFRNFYLQFIDIL